MSYLRVLQWGQPPPFVVVLKYNPAQPRNPPGTSMGGQWAKGRGLADIAPGFREFSPPGEADPLQAERLHAGFTAPAPGMERAQGQASYADIMNAPTGEGFVNLPRGVGKTFQDAQAAAEATRRAEEEAALAEKAKALTKSGVSSVSPLGDEGNANVSYLVEMDDPNHTKAVYKPESGEGWELSFTNEDISSYITNREFSLAEREEVASEVSRALGFGDFVPETHLRTELEIDAPDRQGAGYDDSYAREQYEKYKDKQVDRAYEAVGEEMSNLYYEAQKEHVKDIENRSQEVLDLWNELQQQTSDEPRPYGSPEALRAHPVLPMGSKAPFERQGPKDPMDPLEILDEAKVDVSSSMSEEEKDRVWDILEERKNQGFEKLGELDKDAARDHLSYDTWMEEHQETEARLMQSKIQSFDAWRRSQGFRSEGSAIGSGETRNTEAPHPNGGSLQRFVDGMEDWGDLSHEEASKFAVLDYVIGSMDRHGGNVKFDGDGNAVAIDNGYSMPAGVMNAGRVRADGFQFRSSPVKEWQGSVGKGKITEEMRTQVLSAMNATDWLKFVEKHPSMSVSERESFLKRVANMKEALSTPKGLSELWDRQRVIY